MKTLTTCALVLLLSTAVAVAGEKKKEGISVSFDSDDARTQLAPRHALREARVAVRTRNGAAVLLLTGDVVAVQLSDATLAAVEADEDANLLEEMLVAGVRAAMKKSVEYPIAHIRSAEIRNGNLVLTNDEGKPVFSEIKVNGNNVTRDIAAADAARFVNAFRAAKGRR
jgi:DNA-binding protein YbaB